METAHTQGKDLLKKMFASENDENIIVPLPSDGKKRFNVTNISDPVDLEEARALKMNSSTLLELDDLLDRTTDILDALEQEQKEIDEAMEKGLDVSSFNIEYQSDEETEMVEIDNDNDSERVVLDVIPGAFELRQDRDLEVDGLRLPGGRILDPPT
ncbi:hypothetical protein PCE1_000335 [Barthelona sp. PCE]